MQQHISTPGKAPKTWQEHLEFMPVDPNYPSDRLTYDMSRIRKALAWDAMPSWDKARAPVKPTSKFADVPFNHHTIDELFDALRPGELRLEKKTLDTARSACKRISDHYGVPPHISKTPFSDDCKRLLALVPVAPVTPAWMRYRLTNGMRYLSHVAVSPWNMSDQIAAQFKVALKDEFRHKDPEEAFRGFTRAWNHCVTSIQGFPNVLLHRDVRSTAPLIDWADYPALLSLIEAYLACGQRSCDDDDDPDAEEGDDDFDLDDEPEVTEPLALGSIKGNKAALAKAIWALRADGVQRDQLTQLRDLCAPRRYQQIGRKLTDAAGGAVNHTVMGQLKAVHRLAGHPGVLSAGELKSVRSQFKKHCARHTVYLKTFEHGDQETLAQLDDASVMNAFLSLPTRTANDVFSKKRRHTLSCAYAIQRAAILELWLCAPYRISAFSSIELGQVMSIHVNNIERAILRAPKKQSPNKRAPEHYLNDDAVALLRLYIDEYRPIILASLKVASCAHLFPGRNGNAKASKSLRHQMTRFVRGKTVLRKWRPHVMRKIVPKVTLDGDPGALEVARRTGGWKTDKMLQEVYGQQVHRASQARYLELLEGRRLTAKRSIRKRKKR